MDYRALAAQVLAQTDIHINGDRPWDIQVRDPRFYRRAIAGGVIGLGESYMDGWWDCEALDDAFAKILLADVRGLVRVTPAMLADVLVERLPDLSYFVPGLRPFVSRFRAPMSAAETHYDVGNDFYERLLDSRMIYSCGYWAEADQLETAQVAKLELACRKLALQPGQRVLDIGCGWGSFAKYAAETRGVSVVGVTISAEQQRLAAARCAGLPVEIVVRDYREIQGVYDRIVSFGMFEHVGRKNYAAYMAVAERSLAPDGLFLLETIGDDVSGRPCNPWFQKHVFQSPTSMFPSIQEIASAVEGRFVVEDWHNFGADYAPTLRGWHANLAQHQAWVVARYGERFYRLWEFYLLTCAGAFASRSYQMWQIVFARHGVPGGHRRC